MISIYVALPIPVMRILNYKLLDNMLLPKKGSRVLVPFLNRTSLGIVLGYNYNNKNQKIETIQKILDQEPILSKNLLSLLIWSSKYYLYPIGKVLFYALPFLLRINMNINISELLQWQITELGKNFELNKLNNIPQQKKILLLLKQKSIFHYDINNYFINEQMLYKLKNKKLIKLSKIQSKIKTYFSNFKSCNIKYKINLEQYIIIKKICSNLTFKSWVLVDITNSNKIKIYLNIIEKFLYQKKQILILVPEINLIFNMIYQLKTRFNIPIDIIHSKLNHDQHLSVWLRTKQGDNCIIIGTRSAIFTDFNNLGLIIIDDEHHDSYKQQFRWCYHARDVAVLRAKKENIPIILGSATPSFETLHNIQLGKYCRIDLNLNRNNIKLINNIILNLKNQPLKFGMSEILIKHINKHLINNNQVVIFLNRRGYAPILICYDCCNIEKCIKCNLNYTLYLNSNLLKCHICYKKIQIPIQCKKCGSTNLTTIGLGTEQLEKVIHQVFPHISVTRIDKDTIKNENFFKKIIKTICINKKPHIFISTQIVLTKIIDFPNVTLISLLNIDGVFFSNNYRAIEKFAQFYIQISNYFNKTSEIIIQTYYPDYPFLSILINQGYNAFALENLAERHKLLLPPCSNHIIINSQDYQNKYALFFLNKIRHNIEKHDIHNPRIKFIGPRPAVKHKKNNKFYWKLFLQYPSKWILQKTILNILPQIVTYSKINKITWNIDVDPIEI